MVINICAKFVRSQERSDRCTFCPQRGTKQSQSLRGTKRSLYILSAARNEAISVIARNEAIAVHFVRSQERSNRCTFCPQRGTKQSQSLRGTKRSLYILSAARNEAISVIARNEAISVIARNEAIAVYFVRSEERSNLCIFCSQPGSDRCGLRLRPLYHLFMKMRLISPRRWALFV
jgi:uncharacterized protein (DUF1778 family)